MKSISWKAVVAAMGSAVLTGCMSFSEVGPVTHVRTDDGEKPIAAFYTSNVSYKILGVIPFTTGTAWTNGPIEEASGMKFFTNEATIDSNLASVRTAMKVYGTDRIANLTTTLEDSSAWSFFFINRHIVRTNCLLLEPQK